MDSIVHTAIEHTAMDSTEHTAIKHTAMDSTRWTQSSAPRLCEGDEELCPASKVVLSCGRPPFTPHPHMARAAQNRAILLFDRINTTVSL